MNRAAIIADNQHQYAEIYPHLKWLSPVQAEIAAQKRQHLLKELAAGGAVWGCHDAKVDCQTLSPGCASCAAGTWSCLFINGMCNCRCFYCPTTQDEKGVPTTSSLAFPHVADYLEYLDFFHFKGVGLSGGEPLLTPETTQHYLREIKKRFANSIHVWLYTNGTQVTEPILNQLKEAGLNEIRFDLSADHYNLEKIKLAALYIPIITVEIPAIPEDYALLTATLLPMKEAGVQFLNLHQMRVTPQNYKAFLERQYTFLHGLKLSILESELTALSVLLYNQQQHIGLPINYCSSIYRNRFQAYGARKRFAAEIKKTYEHITDTGMIRTLWLQGENSLLQPLAEKCKTLNNDGSLWMYDKTVKRLYFHVSLYHALNVNQPSLNLGVRYHIARVLEQVTYRNPFKEIVLTSGKKIIIERLPASPEILMPHASALDAFYHLFLSPDAASQPESLLPLIPENEVIQDCETIPRGLQAYF